MDTLRNGSTSPSLRLYPTLAEPTLSDELDDFAFVLDANDSYDAKNSWDVDEGSDLRNGAYGGNKVGGGIIAERDARSSHEAGVSEDGTKEPSTLTYATHGKLFSIAEPAGALPRLAPAAVLIASSKPPSSTVSIDVSNHDTDTSAEPVQPSPRTPSADGTVAGRRVIV